MKLIFMIALGVAAFVYSKTADAADMQLAYAERTSNLTVTATTAATAQTIVTMDDVVVPADTPTTFELSVAQIGMDSGEAIYVSLWIGGTDRGLVAVRAGGGTDNLLARRDLTLSAGTYDVEFRAYRAVGDVAVIANSGGADTQVPTYGRITRATAEYATPEDLAEVDAAGCGGLGNPCQIEAAGSTGEKLDYSWWGIWALVGLMFVLILAPRWFAAFKVTHGG